LTFIIKNKTNLEYYGIYFSTLKKNKSQFSKRISGFDCHKNYTIKKETIEILSIVRNLKTKIPYHEHLFELRSCLQIYYHLNTHNHHQSYRGL